jgi:hypothetical protein
MLLPLAISALSGYSVPTHEAIVDSRWTILFKAILLNRFPASTPEEMDEAHACAYSGCMIQDMGYYPLSGRRFSDLVHYVRSGDLSRSWSVNRTMRAGRTVGVPAAIAVGRSGSLPGAVSGRLFREQRCAT